MVLAILFKSVLLPALLAGGIVLLACRPWATGAARADRPIAPGWAVGPAVAAAYIAADIAGRGTHGLWPVGIQHRLLHAVLLGLIVSTAWGVFRAHWPRPGSGAGPALPPAAAAGAGALLFAAVMPIFTLPMRHQPEWWAVLAAGIVVGGVVWAGVEESARRRPGASAPIAMMVALSGMAVVLVVGLRSASLAQMCGAMAAALGAVMLVSWWRPSLSIAGGAAGTAAVLLVSAGAVGRLLHEPPWTGSVAVALAALAPLAAWIGFAPRLRSLKPWKRTAIQGGAVALIALAAAALAAVPPADTSDEDEIDYRELYGY